MRTCHSRHGLKTKPVRVRSGGSSLRPGYCRQLAAPRSVADHEEKTDRHCAGDAVKESHDG